MSKKFTSSEIAAMLDQIKPTKSANRPTGRSIVSRQQFSTLDMRDKRAVARIVAALSAGSARRA